VLLPLCTLFAAVSCAISLHNAITSTVRSPHRCGPTCLGHPLPCAWSYPAAVRAHVGWVLHKCLRVLLYSCSQLQEVTARIPKTKKLKSTKPKGTRKAKAKANPESTQPPAPNAPAAAESGQPTAPVSLQAPSPPSPAELSATAEAMAAGAQLSRGQSELVLVPPHMPLPARSGGDTSQPASPASLPPPPQQQGGQARLSPTGDRHQQQQRKRTPGWEDALMLKEQQLECQQQHQQESRSSPGIAVTRSTSPGDTSRRSHSPSPAAAGSLTGSPSGSGNSAVSYSIKSSKEKPASKRNKRLCSGT
jgi:hypothetical protein